MTDFLLLGLGIVLLALGGEILIRGALAVARLLAVSPLLSGLVIVGFGTSAPELVVSLHAALTERPDIAVGNVVGSNIANLALILALCALVRPLAVHPRALLRDGTTVLATSLLFVLLAANGALGRIDAMVLLAALGAYLLWAYRSERRGGAASAEMYQAEAEDIGPLPRSAAFAVTAVAVGMALLIGGSRVLLTGAVGIAEGLGLPQAVIGLTLVAVGTSLPELSVSLVAAVRRHADVAVGNVLGSNLFNVLGILGVSALARPLPLDARIVQLDQWVMLGAALLLLVFLYSGMRLSRGEGACLLGLYCVYVWVAFAGYGV